MIYVNMNTSTQGYLSGDCIARKLSIFKFTSTVCRILVVADLRLVLTQ